MTPLPAPSPGLGDGCRWCSARSRLDGFSRFVTASHACLAIAGLGVEPDPVLLGGPVVCFG